MSLYYESHVTLEPVTSRDRALLLARLAHEHGFKVAELLMGHGGRAPSDSFCTARSTRHRWTWFLSEYTALMVQTRDFIAVLCEHEFEVRRYKIESTLIDSKIEDKLELLS